MAAPLLQKKFRMELDFTVTMDSIEEYYSNASAPNQALPYLQQLQAALLNDGPALLRLIQARLVNQLQEYTDHLAGQDSLEGLRRLDASLQAEDPDGFESIPLDLTLLSRPIRISTLDACLSGSSISEAQLDAEGLPHWLPVWADLLPQSPLGQWTQSASKSQGFPQGSPEQVEGHHFSLRYLDCQPDGVHAEAGCTCGLTFYGLGRDEGQAFDTAWSSFKNHLQAFGLASATDPLLNQAPVGKN